jgi:membrane protein implicated in regulation of membrane protease activity
MMVENFEHIGFGQWFRYLTGTLEVIGAITILMPSLAAFGGVLLSCIMVGAIATHLLLIGGPAVPAAVLLILSAIVVFAHRDQIDNLFDRYDT